MYYFNFLRVGKLLRIPLLPQSKVYGKAARSLSFAAAARRWRRHANSHRLRQPLRLLPVRRRRRRQRPFFRQQDEKKRPFSCCTDTWRFESPLAFEAKKRKKSCFPTNSIPQPSSFWRVSFYFSFFSCPNQIDRCVWVQACKKQYIY